MEATRDRLVKVENSMAWEMQQKPWPSSSRKMYRKLVCIVQRTCGARYAGVWEVGGERGGGGGGCLRWGKGEGWGGGSG